MCLSFTEHVRTFGRDCDPSACVLPRLERLLRQRMRRRNLLASPPAYLGYDAPSWDSAGAFDDAVADCYVFAVASRIEGLKNQLRVHANLDGFIIRNVDNFLTERQRRRDPIGYAVFGNVEGAAADLVATGHATVNDTEGDRLRGDSDLRLGPVRAGGPPGGLAEIHAAVAEAPGWNDILPDLTATTDAGRAWVADFLRRLPAAGVDRVRVSDVVSALASRARADWAARHAVPADQLANEGKDEFGALVRLVWPDETVEVTDLLAMLRRVVPERIAQERQQRVRDGLTAVFREWLALIEETGLSRPNQVELAEQLGMSDATVSDYLRRLRQMLATILPGIPDG